MGSHAQMTVQVPDGLIYNGFIIGIWIVAVLLTLMLFFWAWSTFTSKFRMQVEVEDEVYEGKVPPFLQGKLFHQRVWQVTDAEFMHGWWYY